MHRNINRLGILALGLLLWMSGCIGALDRQPFVELTSAAVYAEFENYEGVLAKLYAGLALSGQQGPAGKPDISGIDEGFSSYLRQYWKAQELTTDEAIIGWNDGSLPDYHDMDWTAGNEFIAAMYNRIFYQVVLCNEFIRETTDEKLSQRDFTAAQVETIKEYRAEARLLRALSYWHAIDMFGTVPFVTEEDRTGAFQPDPINRTELFAYVEGELREIEALLPAPRENQDGRLDQGAAWMLLAKLYLNAEVYINQARYTECLVELQKVLDAGYSLDGEYDHLFLTDNEQSNEIIWAIKFDGTRSLTWGGMTFLVHAPVGGSMDPSAFGINGGWNGIRTTPQFALKFDTTAANQDSRANFYREGQAFEIERIFTFTDGWAIEKFRNVDQDGQAGTDPAGNHTDTDFPVFRLADAYLMYAEAVLRNGAGGSEATALELVNELRERAYGDESGNVTAIDLPFILDERGRELHWEGHRRTDLILYGLFT
ncbi:MAG: RagB/SusD family nutrient uptake outer membrane protein, partial [Bacteroidota bacterium]